jgi:hypothetical protein
MTFAFAFTASARDIEKGTFEISGMSNFGISALDFDFEGGGDSEETEVDPIHWTGGRRS